MPEQRGSQQDGQRGGPRGRQPGREEGREGAGIGIEMRGPDGRILATTGPRARAERVRRTARARWDAARTDRERLDAAHDYVRSAIAAAGRGGVDPGPELDRAIRALWAVGQTLTGRLIARAEHTGHTGHTGQGGQGHGDG